MIMELDWSFVFIMIVLTVCCKSENFIISSTDGYMFVKESYNLSINCQCNKTGGSYIVQFVPDNNVANVVTLADDSKNKCFVNSAYTSQCNSTYSSFTLFVPPGKYYNNQSWTCQGNVDTTRINASKTAYVVVTVSVTSIAITPIGNNNVVNIVEGDNQTFDCSTGTSRPAAWIQWYLGGRNVTDEAMPLAPQPEGDKFKSYSRFLYIGNNNDHNKILYCEAVNIYAQQSVKSTEIAIYVQVPVTNVTITASGNNNLTDVVEGENKTCTCTTGPSRPAAWIQWYIGGRNVTDQAISLQLQLVGDKFISSSRLIYIGNDTDHNKFLYCEAGNINGKATVTSIELAIIIQVPVTNVTITASGNNNLIDVVEGENKTFNCTTGPSRPAAWIHWYIGGQDLSSQAIPQDPQLVGDKYVSSSILAYTGKDAEHNKSLFCESTNIAGRQKIKSPIKTFFIKVPVTTVNITSTSNNYAVDIVEGENHTFTCITGPSRPAAWINWYIGQRNVTSLADALFPEQDGDKLVSSSRLTYIGNDTDHNKFLYCEAANIGVDKKSTSMNVTLRVKVVVKKVIITPTGTNNVEYVVEGENKTFNCTTGASRPAAWIQWYIGGQNLTSHAISHHPQPDGDKFISSSSLTYMGYDADHNKSIYCEAANIEWKPRVTSTLTTLYIQVKPKDITLVPGGNSYKIRETHHIAAINCSASCRPECTYYWIGPNGYIRNQSILILGPVYRNESGTYTCYGTNKLGNIESSRVYIEVLYPPIITNLKTNNINNTVAEGTMIMFQCNIECNPKSDIEWKFITTGEVTHKDTAVLESYYTINRTECIHTGIYNCQATNTINEVQEMSSRTIRLDVLCHVRDDVSQVSTPSTIGIKSEDVLNITVHLIAVPPPDISWTFYSNITGNTSLLKSHNVFGDFAHVSTLQKFNISHADYGVYTLTAYNYIDFKYERSFIVIPQGQPSPSSNISKEESNTAVLGAVIGSISCLLVILLIVGASFIIRRRIGKGKDENGRTQLTTLKMDEEDDDGMKDNVLYQSAGPNFKQQKDDSGNEYAAVQKKGSKLNDNDVKETALYSVVKGKPNKKPQGDVYSNVTNTKSKVNGKKSKSSEDVYQNIDIPDISSPIIVPKENNNKDGLQYAELVFNPLPNGSKFVIRGKEDRTIYAVVDTTQNIDPLPDSDDEDIGKNSTSEQRENEME